MTTRYQDQKMKKSIILQLMFFLLIPKLALAQVEEDKLGAWYMYFFNTTFKESPWGIQGDIQYRNWNLGGDLEQLLLRGGITYSPSKTFLKLTLGYGNITTGVYGSSQVTKLENRIYQEALFPVQLGKRIYTQHRFRYEQRFVENQDFRTRYRYNIFLNVPINKAVFESRTLYFASYNEIFINGQRNTGQGNRVALYDRNRFYLGIGYMIKKGLKVQLGVLNQSTDVWQKKQLQFSLHHKI
jgi:hypothetical protein